MKKAKESLYPSSTFDKPCWESVNMCSECGLVGSYDDLHESDPCFLCGGEIEEYGAGRWHKPVYKWSWWIFNLYKIQDGFWELKK